MTTLSGDEPDLELGASGEYVVQLQDRLRGMGLLDKLPDGTYDDQTETAVRQLQSNVGQSGDGKVTQQTWQALDQHMVDQGLYYNPYAGPGQQHWDFAQDDAGEHLVAHEATHVVQQQHGAVAYTSEPQWDGEQWLQWDAQAGQWVPYQDVPQTQAAAASATDHPAASVTDYTGAAPATDQPAAAVTDYEGAAPDTGYAAASAQAQSPAEAEPPVIPHPDNVHPAVRDDERFSDMIDFLRESHGG